MAAKYGTRLAWETAALARYSGWGFNCIADYFDDTLVSDMLAGNLGSVKLPFFVYGAQWSGWHFINDAIWRRSMLAGWEGQTFPTDEVKEFMGMTARVYTGWSGSPSADGTDPNLSDYIDKFLTALLNPTNNEAFRTLVNSPYAIGVSVDDADDMWGFGSGPDDCTTSGGGYHAHFGWLALASPVNYYAQWYDMSDLYNAYNWIFVDPAVHAKASVISFLKAEYATIADLNKVWGSTYTAFDSAATRYTGEAVATTNGSTVSYSHALAHPTNLSYNSMAIKVDGVTMGSDPPCNPTYTWLLCASFPLLAQWPEQLGGSNVPVWGTLNHSTGDMVLFGGAYHQFNTQGTGSTSWGTVSLGETNIIPGTIILRMEGSSGTASPDCRITDDKGTGNSWEAYTGLCASNYTVTGTINYAAGTITGLTITPAISGSYWVQFQMYYKVPLPGTHAITVDYDVNGFGVGTTLADEDGSHTSWLGSLEGVLPKSGNAAGYSSVASAGAYADLNAYLTTYMDAHLTNTVDVIKSRIPAGKLVFASMSGAGGHGGCPRPQVVSEIANHADVLTVATVTPTLQNLLVSWGLGDVPTMDVWEGMTANPDSPFSADGAGTSDPAYQYATQALRGTAMAAAITRALSGRGSGGTSYTTMGIKFWAYTDTTSESTNYGLVSPLDNAYDGVEAKTGSHACTSPINAYTCGGEAANYGDAITPIKAALTGMWTTIGSGGGGSTPLPKMQCVKCQLGR
jgi:hypothetical protein